jgi:hypothetical protein
MPLKTTYLRNERNICGAQLAGKSTLNRLELTGANVGPSERYKKIVMNPEAIDRVLSAALRDCPAG